MLFLMSGLSAYFYLFTLLALGPAIALMVYVYQLDALNREPIGLLWSLVMRGVAAAFVASLLEAIGLRAFGLLSGLGPFGMQFEVMGDFMVVGVIEEGTKYALMARRTWNSPAFDCRFDGVVYAVFTSLGFASMENITYGLAYGPGVLFSRALMAVPAHMGFAVLFGLLYGQAKLHGVRGHRLASALCVAAGYVLSVVAHGLYDSAAAMATDASGGIFLLVVVAVYLIVFKVARAAARHDRRFAS